jgi:8-oxo-dGTP diphosphatase
LLEELGVKPTHMHPLIRVPYDYGERRVLLDVWRIEDWVGEAHGAEGQPIAWRPPTELDAHEFPAANRPVITALRLPPVYLITPDLAAMPDRGLGALRRHLVGGVTLVQLRSRGLPRDELGRLVREVAALCASYRADLLVNDDPRFVALTEADGVHLPSERLMRLAERPLDEQHWVAASCHDARELERACRIGADFAVLSPVAPTASHPGTAALGWHRFAEIVEQVPIPVFALGGMRLRDLPIAKANRAQGIAGVSEFFGST